MSLQKVKSFLGIAQRAGFLVSGSNMILNELSAARGKKWLVLVAKDATTPTGEDLVRKALRAGLRVYKIPMDMFDMGLAIGKNQRGYVMIKDRGIADRVVQLVEEMEVPPLDQS